MEETLEDKISIIKIENPDYVFKDSSDVLMVLKEIERLWIQSVNQDIDESGQIIHELSGDERTLKA